MIGLERKVNFEQNIVVDQIGSCTVLVHVIIKKKNTKQKVHQCVKKHKRSNQKH